MRRSIYTIAFVLLTIYLTAQTNEPLIGDRPDQTESAYTISKGMVQIETGFTMSQHETGSLKITNYDYNSTLIRWGIGQAMEWRFQQDFSGIKTENTLSNSSVTEQGAAGFITGFKVLLTEEETWRPRIAFLADVTLPWTGNKEFRPDYIAPSFKFSFEHTLSQKVSLGYNLGGTWDGVGPEMNAFYSLVAGFSLSDRMGAFAELFGEIPESGNGDHRIDGGVTYLILPNLQFDLAGGFGITSHFEGYFVTTGIIYRFPE